MPRAPALRWAWTALAVLALPLLTELGWRLALGAMNRAARDTDAFEIVAIGGSTTAGQPYPSLSFPDLVGHLLGDEVGGRPVAVHNLARRGESLYPQAVALQRFVTGRDADQPGVLLVYAGHNERIRPQAPDRDQGYVERGWPDALRDALAPQALLHRLRRWGHLRRPESLRFYEDELRRVIRMARAAGLTPVVATVASNMGGVEPNAPLDEPFPSKIRTIGERLEAARDWEGARAHYAAALEARPAFAALLEYRRARALLALGRDEEARHARRRAVDLDPQTSFGRGSSALNERVRRVARDEGVALVDVEVVFEAASARGVIDAGLFIDGHHPNLRGMRVMAAAFADEVARRSEARVARRLDSDEAALAIAGLGVEELAVARLSAASWLVSVSCLHPWPRDRLSLAEAHYRGALSLEPGGFSATLGLALLQALRRAGWLQDERRVEVMGEWEIFHRARICLRPEALQQMIDDLGQAGIDAELLSALDEARRTRYREACGE
jgi:tetratricopeptide (TPR) repeat protein